MNNKWEAEDSDDEINEEYIENEVAPPEVNEEFANNILKIKHSLYNSTVMAPKEGTPEAQNNGLIQDYLNKVNDVYVLSLNAQRGNNVVTEDQLTKFPVDSREPIKQTLAWISEYFRKNRAPDTIPYSDYIYKSFKEYQFVQDNSFE